MVGIQSVMYNVYLLVICVVLVTAAPATRSRSHHHDNTKVSLVLRALNSDRDQVPLSRTRRHVSEDEASRLQSDLLRAVDADTEASPSQRRHRRSAVFMMATAVRFCETYKIYCTRVVLKEGDLEMQLNVAEE